MAKAISKAVGEVFKTVADIQSPYIFQSPLNKGWRAKILFNRGISPMAKVDQDEGKQADKENYHLAIPESYSYEQKNRNGWKAMQIQGQSSGLSARESIDQYSTNHTLNKAEKQPKNFKNEIIIVNATESPAVYLTLQNRPNEIEVEPVSSWSSVNSMGRNSPFQIYTGSEDTITLDISWYSIDQNRQDVVNKCRLLESWTKSDGYIKSPPILQILWGNSDLFDGVDFVLTSAAYRLTHFQDGVRNQNGEVIDLKLYPNQATQKLIFKRVSSDNLRTEDIIPPDKIKSTSGVTYREKV